MVDKIFSISSLQFHHKNIEFIIQTLLKNGYPLNFIFFTINKRLIYNISYKNSGNTVKKKSTEYQVFHPYVHSVSDKFQIIIKKYKFFLHLTLVLIH